MTRSHSYIWSLWSLLLAAAFGCPAASADSITGEARPLAGDPAAWRWRVADCAPRLESQWWTPTGEVVASEAVQYGAGGHVSYSYDRSNVGERAEVDIAGGRAIIQLIQDGHTRRHEVNSSLPVLAGPMLVTFARDHLMQLRRGVALTIAYVVPDHLTSVDLRLRLASESAERITVLVQPLSALVRLVVSDARIEFDHGGRFTGFEGRVLPVKFDHSKREDMSARLLATGRSETCPARRVAAASY